MFLLCQTGIFAYLNYQVPRTRKEIFETLVKGLQRLEYRGYDSAGKDAWLHGAATHAHSDTQAIQRLLGGTCVTCPRKLNIWAAFQHIGGVEWRQSQIQCCVISPGSTRYKANLVCR